MGKSNILPILICTAFFSTLGGALTTLLLSTPTAHAGCPGEEKILEADTLRVGSLKIVDETGKTRIYLSATTKGMPAIKLYDSNGKCRAALGMGNDLPYLSLYDEQEKPRLQTYLGNHSFPEIRFYDQFTQVEWALPIFPQHRKDGWKWPD